MNEQHFSMVSGEDRTFALVALDAAMAPLNLTGAVLSVYLRDPSFKRTVLQKTATATDAANGLATFPIAAADLECSAVGAYPFEAVAVISGLNTVVSRGDIKVLKGWQT